MKNKIQLDRKFMNTTITIRVIQESGESTVDINNSISDAFGEFDRIVNKYTRFDDSSELSELNRNSGEWQPVSPEFFRLINMMLDIAEHSNGAYDPTIIDFLETYGYDQNYNFDKLDNPQLQSFIDKIAAERPSWRDIDLDHHNLKVKLAKGQRVDLGGIGKGYAIDKAFDHLDKFQNVLIDAGGDVRAKGSNESGKPWVVGLFHLDHPSQEKQVLGTLSGNELVVAASGSWARKVKQFHHIINPNSGIPVEGVQTVYVTGPNAALADGWATAMFVGGKNLLEKRLPGIETMLIGGQNVVKTNGFTLD